MNRCIFSLLVLCFLVVADSGIGATNRYVLQGDNPQVQINAADPGDTLIIQAGPYTNDLIFSKPVTVLRTGTNDLIRFLGQVQIQGTGSINFAQCKFTPTVGIQSSGTVAFTVSFGQCSFLASVNSQGANLVLSQVACAGGLQANLSTATGTNLQAYDSTFQGGLNITGGKVLIKRCESWGLIMSSNAALEALRMTNHYPGITATASAGSGTPFVAVQSLFDYSSISLSGYKVWLGYNTNYLPTYSSAVQLTNCDSVLVGNIILPDGGPGVVYAQGGTLKAYNNYIRADSQGTALYGIWVRSNVAEIVNNTIVLSGRTDGSYALGIKISDGGGPITLRANIIRVLPDGGVIEAQNQTVFLSYCDLLSNRGIFFSGNIPMINCIADGQLNDFQPCPTCVDAGPPEPVYNDRADGTRNDIGYTGGPLFNRANYTNDNPMVFLLTGYPQIVFKGPGGQTNIQVNAAASAGHH